MMRGWILSSLSQPGAAREAVQQHRKIFDAIRMRDVTGARQAMDTHLDAMGVRLLQSHLSTSRQA